MTLPLALCALVPSVVGCWFPLVNVGETELRDGL